MRSWGSGNTDTVSTIVSLENQNEFRDKLVDIGADIVLVTHGREKKHSQELSIARGEHLEVCKFIAQR